MTRQEIICQNLIQKGLKEVKGRTSKYRVFDRKDGQFYFVGKNGALRVGRNVSESISLPVNPRLFDGKGIK